jgi:ABC-2 type transport system permease protein
MSNALLFADGVFAVVKRDARTFMTYRTRLFSQIAGIFLSITTFYYVSRLVEIKTFESSSQYFAFVVVGLVIMLVLQSALSTPGLFRQELVAGTFERMLTSGLGPVGGALAMTLFPILLSCIVATSAMTLAGIVFGLPLQWSTAPLAIPVGALGALAFAALGMFFLAGVIVFKSSMGATWVIAGLSLTGGVYFPVALLPAWIQWVSYVQPFTPAVDAMRHLLVGTPLLEPIWLELLRLAGFAAITVPLAGWTVAKAVNIARRRGTILEY